jgi:predicted lysophospholipase L1 biosynthesis ABC-type transport system permease subunit
VIVNEAFTRQYFDGESALGRRIAFAGREREIIGIVGNVQVRPGWGDHGPLAAMPLAYIPLTQANDPTLRLVHGWFQTNVIVRARHGGGETESVLRNALASADPQLPIASIRRIDEVQSAAIAQPRVMMTLLVALAVAAALLSAAGIHGLIAASVTERTREIGIRLALGSTAAGAVRLLAAPGVVLAGLGVLLGVLLARTAARLLDHFVWGVSRTDVTTFAAVAVFALAVAVVSSLGPALRILRLDPAKTLRAE